MTPDTSSAPTTTDPSPTGADTAVATVTATEAADVLGVSAATVRRLARDGRLEVALERPLRLTRTSVTRHRDERGGKVPVARQGAGDPTAKEQSHPPMRWDGRARRWVPAR
ncbi:hypothetical protein NUM3379_01890 [Kineococcus sp. NUM-3379]